MSIGRAALIIYLLPQSLLLLYVFLQNGYGADLNSWGLPVETISHSIFVGLDKTTAILASRNDLAGIHQIENRILVIGISSIAIGIAFVGGRKIQIPLRRKFRAKVSSAILSMIFGVAAIFMPWEQEQCLRKCISLSSGGYFDLTIYALCWSCFIFFFVLLLNEIIENQRSEIR